MGRAPRIDIGERAYHIINRSNGRATIFHDDKDYLEFEYLLSELKATFDMRILAYVIMPNHWHLLLFPKKDGSLGKSLQWLGTIHSRRHHTRKGTIGTGHVYQGRYRSSLIKNDQHLLTVLKYIERNPVRAYLVNRPEAWRWGSAYRRLLGNASERAMLSDLPVDVPREYAPWLNEAEPAEELKCIRQTVNQGVPYVGSTQKY